jgi:hypothetical protein
MLGHRLADKVAAVELTEVASSQSVPRERPVIGFVFHDLFEPDPGSVVVWLRDTITARRDEVAGNPSEHSIPKQLWLTLPIRGSARIAVDGEGSAGDRRDLNDLEHGRPRPRGTIDVSRTREAVEPTGVLPDRAMAQRPIVPRSDLGRLASENRSNDRR